MDPPIIGASPVMVKLRSVVLRVADTNATVVITGESGSGKELVARNLHSRGRRRHRPFVAINCAALNPGVLESELFGHGRGSFTGAVSAHAGLFEQADGGTIFLDEVGEVPTFIQAKLLRVLQDHEVRRMGSADSREVDVRVLAATNTNLDERVRSGEFRLDLYYRLHVVEVEVPPLRHRGDDIVELLAHFFAVRGHSPPHLSDDVRKLMMEYRWPGNVRELENEVERVLALNPDVCKLTPKMLSTRLRRGANHDVLDIEQLYEKPLPKAVGYLEENLLRKTLARTNWNKSQSARELGLSRQGLLKKIKRYGITADDPSPDSA